MRLLRRWWFWAVCAVVIVAMGAGTAVWVQQRAASVAGQVSVEVGSGTYDLGADASQPLTVNVSNESGRKLADAELRITIGYPDDDYPAAVFSSAMFDPECGVEDPGTEPECVAEEKRAKRQSCETGRGPETVVNCDGDIAKGEDEYVFSYQFSDLPTYEYLAGVEDYPDSTIHATLLVDGERVAADKERLSVDLASQFRRVDIDDLPTDMAIDDPSSQVHDWSFTIINDTDDDVVDATIAVGMSSGSHAVDIGTPRSGCERDAHPGPAWDTVDCPGVDIPAGEKMTVEMHMNVAEGAAARLDDYCPPGPSTMENCRADSAAGTVFIDVKPNDDPFAETRRTVSVRVDG